MRVVGADGINLRITVDDGKTIALDIEADGKGGNTGRQLADGTLVLQLCLRQSSDSMF
jgi:hypothetical protein